MYATAYLSDRFRSRESTLKHDNERARRSFFKWVCKHEMYGPLEIVHFGRWTHHKRGRAKYSYGSGFTNGHPEFRNWRSAAYDAWQADFEDVRDKWIEQEREQRQREDEAKRAQWAREFEARIEAHAGRARQRLHSAGVVDIFQTLGAASAISHELKHHDSSNH